MKLLGTKDLESNWDAMVAHERLYYGSDGYLEAKDRVLGDWWKNKCHWWAAVADGETIVSSASATLLAETDFQEMLRRTDIGPKSMVSYYKRMEEQSLSRPVLYISSIIIANRLHAPYLFKALSRDLKDAQEQWGTGFANCVSIALNKKSKFLLERHGFKSIGLCRGIYPVYAAHRNDAPIINALLG